jgi:hypothetical protein
VPHQDNGGLKLVEQRTDMVDVTTQIHLIQRSTVADTAITWQIDRNDLVAFCPQHGKHSTPAPGAVGDTMDKHEVSHPDLLNWQWKTRP